MKKEIIHGQNGYDIPGIQNIIGHEKQIVIISHGFGSSKESPTAKAVAAALPKQGIGTYSFDFPAHGDSPVDGGKLRLANCTADLAAVEAHVHELNPEAEIAYFSSSFGAYINLIYLATTKHAGRKSFLRCTAVDMPGILRHSIITPKYRAQLTAQGFAMMDEGYIRPLKITSEFIRDLEEHDLFKLYRPGMADLAMIHGADDETAPLSDARRFAEFSGAELTEVQGADHRFQIPGGMELILETAGKFFCKADSK